MITLQLESLVHFFTDIPLTDANHLISILWVGQFLKPVARVKVSGSKPRPKRQQ
jgi:hypothetical protein